MFDVVLAVLERAVKCVRTNRF